VLLLVSAGDSHLIKGIAIPAPTLNDSIVPISIGVLAVLVIVPLIMANR